MKLQYGLFLAPGSRLVLSRSRNFRIDEVHSMHKPVKTNDPKRAGLAPIDRDLIFLTWEGPEVKALITAIHVTGTGHGSVNHVAAEARQNY